MKGVLPHVIANSFESSPVPSHRQSRLPRALVVSHRTTQGPYVVPEPSFLAFLRVLNVPNVPNASNTLERVPNIHSKWVIRGAMDFRPGLRDTEFANTCRRGPANAKCTVS